MACPLASAAGGGWRVRRPRAYLTPPSPPPAESARPRSFAACHILWH